ncbi:concanavalin A-like lectin/glucanase domain-containing protein [Mycena capillaripes]|nr:concanavalin A-like lectin/glucanase domain-containing protein [Mycena capillaripes]
MFRLSCAALAFISVSIPISMSIPIFSDPSFGAGSQSRSWPSLRAPSKSTLSGLPYKNWTLTDNYQGEDFLEHWNFFNRSDPTHGLVNYQNAANAKHKGLASVQGKSLILAVDNKTHLAKGAKRDSVRISSKKLYNAGSLFIADFVSVPAACGVWPAWWSVGVGASWPNGEVDVLENVHKVNNNKMTLHTSVGCTVEQLKPNQLRGKVDRTDCASSGKNNQGCGVMDYDTTAYGDGFNKAGGGVYAHTWEKDAIHIWHFARKDIPEDIKNGAPDPSKWPLPTGSFVAGSCDFSKHFHDHTLTIDTTIGGDWGGDAKGLKAAHCPQTAAELVEDPKNFDGASIEYAI